jgi:GT2 family glycosyltransferase
VFVDADVVLEPAALGRVLALFADRPGLSAAVGRYSQRPAAPGLIAQYHNSFTRFHHDLSARQIDWFWGALGAVRKNAFWTAGGFNELYRGASAEDMEFGRTLAGLGHLILYCPEVEGAHAHRFTLWTMMRNDYKKAVLGTKLRLLDRLPRRAPGFANIASVISAVLAPALFLALALCPAAPGHRAVPLYILIALLVLNARFYRFLAQYLKGPRILLALPLHWLQLTIMLLGAAAGTIGYLLRRSPYGRPGWI